MKTEQATQQFLAYLANERRYSAATVETYGIVLDDFKRFLDSNGIEDIEEVGTQEVREWQMRHGEEGEAASTIAKKLSTLRSLFGYLRKQHIVEKDVMAKIITPKKPRVLPVFFREKEVERIYCEALFDDTFEGRRDRLVLHLLYETGMRRAEMAGLTESSVDLRGRTIKVHGKRNKERVIPIENELAHTIQDYLTLKQEITQEEKLLVDGKGRPVTCDTIYQIVKKYMVPLSNADKISPHVFRHTFATHMLKEGANIDAIKELLGHSSLSSTEVYTHVTKEHLKDVYQQAHPRAEKKHKNIKIQKEDTMNVTINAVKFKADEKLEKFISEKVAKLDRLTDNATKCEVTLKVDKPESENNKIAEISMALPGQTLFNSKQADTFEEAVSGCIDTLRVQIDKYKERYK